MSEYNYGKGFPKRKGEDGRYYYRQLGEWLGCSDNVRAAVGIASKMEDYYKQEKQQKEVVSIITDLVKNKKTIDEGVREAA